MCRADVGDPERAQLPRFPERLRHYLPATDEPVSEQPVRVPAPSTGIARRAASAEVLVVEDNPALAEVIKRLPHPAGYTVTVALTPGAALDIIARPHIVDLVVTDVVRPELTGPDKPAQRRHPCARPAERRPMIGCSDQVCALARTGLLRVGAATAVLSTAPAGLPTPPDP